MWTFGEPIDAHYRFFDRPRVATYSDHATDVYIVYHVEADAPDGIPPGVPMNNLFRKLFDRVLGGSKRTSWAGLAIIGSAVLYIVGIYLHGRAPDETDWQTFGNGLAAAFREFGLVLGLGAAAVGMRAAKDD